MAMKNSPCIEGKIEVSPEIINHPLGFVIDSGGSLTKLVYRSKEDYKDTKPLHTLKQGVLRLKSFTIEQLPSLWPFIKDNVDIALTPKHHEVCWWHTGVTSKFFKAQLDKDMNIKTRLYSEMLGLRRSLENYDLLKIPFHPTCLENIAEASRACKQAFSMIDRLQEFGEEINLSIEKDDKGEKKDTFAQMAVLSKEHYLMQLISTQNYEKWIKEHLKPPSTFHTPSLILLVGSAGVVSVVDEKFKFKFVDFSSASGKTLCALSEEMLGEKDFDKFMKLAEEGDSGNVDIKMGDMNLESYKEDDWYSVFPEDMVAFELGKLSSNNYNGRGEHSKADLAAGLLSLQLHTLSKMLISCIRISRIFRVYVCGSMFQFSHVRKIFEGHFYKDSILISLEYGEPFKIHFFDKPGYLVGLGVWVQNVKEENDRKAIKSEQ